MKITINLVLTVFIASLVPPLYFSLNEYIENPGIELNLLFSNLAIYLLYSTVLTNIISLIVYFLLLWLQKHYPWSNSVAKRLFIELISTSVLVAVLIIVFVNILFKIIPANSGSYNINIYRILQAAILMTLILLPIAEGVFFFQEWRESFIEKEKLRLIKEKLEKQHIISQYETLKDQINPHFLFNSLNVLSALIHEDTEKAEEFIDEFASIYRYVLDVSVKPDVPLKNELEFVDSYLFLQKIRFGENLKIEKNIQGDIHSYLILPLSIQLLIENAIKHNKISKEHPLKINMDLVGDKMIIRNNLQTRSGPVVSTGIGLKNIKERYKLYNGTEPQFEKVNNEFIAQIPLIKDTQ